MTGPITQPHSSLPAEPASSAAKLTCQDAAAPGFIFGVFLGQSASPVLGVCITGLFALLAAMFKPDALKNAPSITREFIVAVSIWLGVGATVGVIIRANDLLRWEPGLRRKYELMGFSKVQIDRIIDHEARVAAGEYRSLRADASDLGFDDAEVKILMDRMTRTLVLPVGRSPQTSAGKTEDAKKQAPLSAPKPGSDSSLWSGAGAETFGQILNEIKEAEEDDGTTPRRKQIEAELRLIRGFMTDLNAKLEKSSTVDEVTIRTFVLFQRYCDSLLDTSKGDSLKERRQSVSNIERAIHEILNPPIQ